MGRAMLRGWSMSRNTPPLDTRRCDLWTAHCLGKRVFITVADASADQHAAELVRSLRSLDPAIEIDALGGPKMKAAGANVLEDTVEKAAMGWRGALRVLEARRWLKNV